MAYLFRNPGSRFWYAGFDYIAEDGKTKRVQRSTKLTSRKDAQALAVMWEEVARKGSHGRLTVSAARSMLSEITERFTGAKLEVHTVRDVLEGWLANKRPGLARRSVTRYEMVVRDFIKHLAARADAPVESLQEADVIAFRDAEQKASKSAQTINLNVKIVRSAFEAARKRGLITHNPAACVDRIAGEAIEKEPFTAEEVERILAAAPDVEWRGLILLGFYTGGRIGDLAHLLWSNVDLEAGSLAFLPEKTRKSGRQVRLPIHPALASFLASLPHPAGKDAPLFPRLASKRVAGERGLSRTFSRIMAAAGVDSMQVETGFKSKTGSGGKGKARKLSRRSFHSLRHTHVSMMANKGVPEEIRRKITLHASGDVHARYTHHEAETIRTALAVLPSLNPAKP